MALQLKLYDPPVEEIDPRQDRTSMSVSRPAANRRGGGTDELRLAQGLPGRRGRGQRGPVRGHAGLPRQPADIGLKSSSLHVSGRQVSIDGFLVRPRL